MAKELTRRAARAELRKMIARQGNFGLVNLLPTPHDPARFNVWGDDLNTFLVVSHNIDGTLKSSVALPAGGAAGDVLGKLSSADGDYGLLPSAHGSDNTPLGPIAGGDAGTGPGLSFDNHRHTPEGASGIQDAYPVTCPNPLQTGDVCFIGGANVSNQGMFGNSFSYPFRMAQAGTFRLGINVKVAGGAGCVIRLSVHNDGTRGLKPGTLVGGVDLGTIDGTSATAQSFPTAVALDNQSRYWVVVAEQGGAATHPQLMGFTPSNFSIFNAAISGGPVSALRHNLTTGAIPDNPTVVTQTSAFPFVISLTAQ